MNSLNCMQNLAATFERKRKHKQLPRFVNTCLDELTKKMARSKGFKKFSQKRQKQSDEQAASKVALVVSS